MGKLLIFGLLFYVFGNPIIALIVVLILLYFLDRRFIGIFPSVLRPFRLIGRSSRLKRELALNPHDTQTRHELARLLIERRKFAEAEPYLRAVLNVKDDSADVRCELGWTLIRLGQTAEGEKLIREALDMDPKAKYGEPYLQLGETLADSRPEEAIGCLERFREIHSSSCEGYYRLGRLYRKLGRKREAKDAFHEALNVYRMLPKYKRRQERRWAMLAWFGLPGL